MVFSPLFINSEVQEGLTFAKQAKLKNTNYLFSDIINVFINQEQDNNSFPTLLKTQQSELPTLDVSSLLKENNINVTELVQQNLEEIKIEINTPEASQNVASSEQKNVSLMNIISALINNSSESSNINAEKSSTQKNESAADNNAQLNLGSIKEKLENGEKILLSLNTESGEKSFIISAKVNNQNSSDSKETKNDLVINVNEINESKETLDAFIKSINAEGNDFSLVDKSANVIAQMTLLSPTNKGDLNIKNLTEENPIYVFQNSDQVSGSQKSAIKLNSNNYFFNDSINFEVKSENSTDIKISVNDKPTASNDLKLTLVKNDNNINPIGSVLNELKNIEPGKIITSTKVEASAKVSAETNPQIVNQSETPIIAESAKKANTNIPVETDQKIVPTNSKVSAELPNVLKEIINNSETAKDQSQTVKTSIPQNSNDGSQAVNSKNELVKNLTELDSNAKVTITKETVKENNNPLKQVHIEKSNIEATTNNVKFSAENKELLSKTDANSPKAEVNNTTKNIVNTIAEIKNAGSVKSEIVSESGDKNLANLNKASEVNKVSTETVKSVNVDKQANVNASKSIKENITTEVQVNKKGNEVKAAASEKTISSEINSAKNEVVKGKAPIIIEGNEKPEQKNVPETKNLTASEKLVSKETNVNKTADTNIAQVKEKQNVEIKSTITNSKNIEANIGTKEKVDQEPISVKVKRNIKEINFIKSDSETVKTSEKEILKNVQNTSTNAKPEQKNIATNNINVVSKGLKPETTSSVSVDKEIKSTNPNVSENKEIINKNNIVHKENAIPKENQNVKNDLKESNSAQVKANVNEQKENPINLSKPLPTEKPIAQAEKVLQGQKTAEPEKIVSQEKVAQTEKSVQAEKPIVQAEKVLQGQKTADPEKLVSQEKAAQTEKPVQAEKPIVQTEKVLQGQKTVEPEKIVPQEKVAQTEKPVQAEKVLQGQKTVEPEKLVSLEKAVQTEKPVQAEKQVIQNEKAASILKNEISDKEKPSETYDSNKAKEVVTEVKNTDAKEKSFADPKDIQSKNNVAEKAKEIITGAANSEPKFEKEASVIKEVSLKNEVSKNEKIIPNEYDVAANIKSSDGNNTKNENTSKDDSNKNELYKTSDHKDVKTELRDRTETRFEKELINSKEEVARKVGNEIKSETARFNNAERIVKTSEIMKELAKHVQKQEKNTLVLQIDPENLGKMKIKLEMIENSVRAKIEVESQIIRHHIESNINDLYSQLSKNGIQLSGINISLSESDTKTNKQFSGKKKGSGQNIKDEEIDISEDMKTKSLGYNTYDYVV